MKLVSKRIWIHVVYGSACLWLAHSYISLRLRIASEELEIARAPDFWQQQRLRTLEEWIRERREAHDRAVAVVQQVDFRSARLAGSKVIALAEKAASASGSSADELHEPHVMLVAKGGRLEWHVTYYTVPHIGGGFFTVSIDDADESTSIYGGM